jgi:hypothetical protein
VENFQKAVYTQLGTYLEANGEKLFYFLFSLSQSGGKKGLWIDSAFHTVLSGLAFNSGRTVFTN